MLDVRLLIEFTDTGLKGQIDLLEDKTRIKDYGLDYTDVLGNLSAMRRFILTWIGYVLQEFKDNIHAGNSCTEIDRIENILNSPRLLREIIIDNKVTQEGLRDSIVTHLMAVSLSTAFFNFKNLLLINVDHSKDILRCDVFQKALVELIRATLSAHWLIITGEFTSEWTYTPTLSNFSEFRVTFDKCSITLVNSRERL